MPDHSLQRGDRWRKAVAEESIDPLGFDIIADRCSRCMRDGT